jgi:hypothetical protein
LQELNRHISELSDSYHRRLGEFYQNRELEKFTNVYKDDIFNLPEAILMPKWQITAKPAYLPTFATELPKLINTDQADKVLISYNAALDFMNSNRFLVNLPHLINSKYYKEIFADREGAAYGKKELMQHELDYLTNKAIEHSIILWNKAGISTKDIILTEYWINYLQKQKFDYLNKHLSAKLANDYMEILNSVLYYGQDNMKSEIQELHEYISIFSTEVEGNPYNDVDFFDQRIGFYLESHLQGLPAEELRRHLIKSYFDYFGLVIDANEFFSSALLKLLSNTDTTMFVQLKKDTIPQLNNNFELLEQFLHRLCGPELKYDTFFAIKRSMITIPLYTMARS